MKAILFILILFINIFKNMATAGEDGGGPSQRKDKRPAEIIDLNSEPNTEEEENTEMNPGCYVNSTIGIKIGGEGGQRNPSKKLKSSEPKIIQIDNSAKHIKVDDPMDSVHIFQQLTEKNTDVKYISLEHGGIPKRLFPVSLLQQKFGTSLIRQNIGENQQNSHSETVENRENTHYPIPLSFYDPKEGMVRIWHQFHQWQQEQRQNQQNSGKEVAGIILEPSSLETGKNAPINDNQEIVHQQNLSEILKPEQKSANSLLNTNMKGNENEKPSKRGARLNYKEVFRFNNEEQFKEWIKLSNWTRCKYYQRKGFFKCNARLKVIRLANNFIIEEADIKHYHQPIQPFVGQNRPVHP